MPVDAVVRLEKTGYVIFAGCLRKPGEKANKYQLDFCHVNVLMTIDRYALGVQKSLAYSTPPPPPNNQVTWNASGKRFTLYLEEYSLDYEHIERLGFGTLRLKLFLNFDANMYDIQKPLIMGTDML